MVFGTSKWLSACYNERSICKKLALDDNNRKSNVIT
jgi:hypothetical protein